MPSISFWRKGVQLHLCRLYQLPDKIGVSKGVSPLAHDFATQSVVCYTCCHGWPVKWGFLRMETLTLPGRKTDSFLRMGMGKNLGGFKSGSGDMNHYVNNLLIS